MFEIQNVNETNFQQAFNFLNSVPSIATIDNEILKNGVIVFLQNKVIASISFEIFDNVGLIRYFVFKRNLDNIVLNHLLDALTDNAIKMNIKKLICVADNEQIEDLFKEFNFKTLDKKIFINEEEVSKSNFSNSNFLFKDI